MSQQDHAFAAVTRARFLRQSAGVAFALSSAGVLAACGSDGGRS